jgi:hypothetical protein
MTVASYEVLAQHTDVITAVARSLDALSVSRAAQTNRTWAATVACDDSVKVSLVEMHGHLRRTAAALRTQMGSIFSRCRFVYDASRGVALPCTFDGDGGDAVHLAGKWRAVEARERQGAEWLARVRGGSMPDPATLHLSDDA